MNNFQVLGDVDPFLQVNLSRNQKIYCEANAMVYMDGSLDLNARMNGGVIQSIFRSFANGESFFQQEIIASRGDGIALLSPVSPGGIEILEVNSQKQYFVSDGAYLAATSDVNLNAKMQNLGTALFGQNGGFFIGETSGNGYLAVNGFGSTFIMDVDTTNDNNEAIVDNGHVIAWEKSLQYRIAASTNKKHGFLRSIANSVMSSEGLVIKFKGKGKVVICSRNKYDYLSQLANNLGLNKNS